MTLSGQDDAVEIIKSYNLLVPLLLDQARVSILSLTRANLRLAGSLHRYLAAQGITPGAYLASCFAKHHWRYLPKLSRLELPAYQTYFDANKNEAYLWWGSISRELESRTAAGLSPGHEIVKKRFLSEPDGSVRCLEHDLITGGFHLASKLCGSCPQKEPCRHRDS